MNIHKKHVFLSNMEPSFLTSIENLGVKLKRIEAVVLRSDLVDLGARQLQIGVHLRLVHLVRLRQSEQRYPA